MGKNILIVLLVVIILVLGGFLVYDFLNKEDKPGETLPSNQILASNETEVNEENNQSETLPSNETSTSKDTETTPSSNNTIDKKITGIWSVKKAFRMSDGEKEEEVDISDIYGSSASYGCGDLTLNANSFTDYIRPISSIEISDKGTYMIKQNKIILQFEDSTTKELIYNSKDNTIQYPEYENYVLILYKK